MSTRDSVYYEKGETVLWALTPEGILLHNFANRKYVELKGAEHLIWSFLDGAHTHKEILDLISSAQPANNGSGQDLRELIDETVEQLLSGGFIAKTSN